MKTRLLNFTLVTTFLCAQSSRKMKESPYPYNNGQFWRGENCQKVLLQPRFFLKIGINIGKITRVTHSGSEIHWRRILMTSKFLEARQLHQNNLRFHRRPNRF